MTLIKWLWLDRKTCAFGSQCYWLLLGHWLGPFLKGKMSEWLKFLNNWRGLYNIWTHYFNLPHLLYLFVLVMLRLHADQFHSLLIIISICRPWLDGPAENTLGVQCRDLSSAPTLMSSSSTQQSADQPVLGEHRWKCAWSGGGRILLLPPCVVVTGSKVKAEACTFNLPSHWETVHLDKMRTQKLSSETFD